MVKEMHKLTTVIPSQSSRIKEMLFSRHFNLGKKKKDRVSPAEVLHQYKYSDK